MEPGSFVNVSDLYKNFIRSHGCENINSYPGIYKFIYALAFGNCNVNENEIDKEYQRIMRLSINELILLGVNLASYPFLLIGLHKSIVYGRMKNTDKVINIAKKIVDGDEWLAFYEDIYSALYDIINNNKDERLYINTVASLSSQINCNENEINKYKCKVLAILGDLRKYAETRNGKRHKGLGLYTAIDADLRYISKKFRYDRQEPKDKIIPTLLYINNI